MYYTIYKTTNTKNGKIYIGKHQTNNLDDSYMGSGKLLIAAINKYGIDNFKKEILFVFDTENEMNSKEAELVTESFCLSENNYNLCSGGNGGWSYVNRNQLNLRTGMVHTAETRQLISKSRVGFKHSDEFKQFISDDNKRTNKSRGMKTSAALSGRSKTSEHKKKISNKLKSLKNTKTNIMCPHCGFEGKPPNIYKYHFKNCAGIV